MHSAQTSVTNHPLTGAREPPNIIKSVPPNFLLVKGPRMNHPDRLIFRLGKFFEASASGRLAVVLAFVLGLAAIGAWTAPTFVPLLR